MDRLRIVLGVILIIIAILYGSDPVGPVIPDKLDRPEEDIVKIIDDLPEISDPSDANKVAALFSGLSEEIPDLDLKNNLEVQYLLDGVGKEVMGNDLVSPNGTKKYPEFSPAAAKMIEKIIGPQDEKSELTDEEAMNLSELLYGFAWRLYNKTADEVYEKYLVIVDKAIAEYNLLDVEPDNNEDCICEGNGYVIHGDGHKTDCPCIESGEDCEHDPTCKPNGMAPDFESESKKVETVHPDLVITEEKKSQPTSKKTKRGLFKWLKK